MNSSTDVGAGDRLVRFADLERLWTAVGKAMRLDEADPVTQWRERAATLAARAKALDALKISELTYSGDGTDLTVGLIPDCR